MNRDELMSKIQETGFAVFDTVLFLDSHPACRVALDFYNENKHLYDGYVAEYEKKLRSSEHRRCQRRCRQLDMDTGPLALGTGGIVCGITKKDLNIPLK